jgi:hypothetical protein
MGIKEDYQRAVELAKAGELEKAQALLITIDHPKAEAMLAKVNAAIATRGDKASKKHGFSFVGLALAFLVIVIAGVASSFLGNQLFNAGYDETTYYGATAITFVLLFILGVGLTRRFGR